MHVYFKHIQNFLLKKSFDFDRSDVDIYNFHPQLTLLLAAKGVFFNNKDSIFRFIWPSFIVMLTLAGLGLEMMFVYHGVDVEDYSYATECFCYCMLLGSIPPVYAGLGVNKPKIYEIVEEMNADIKFVCSLGSRYRKPFLKGQLLIWQLCWAWTFFVCLVGLLFIIFPLIELIYQTLFVTQDEFTKRPMQFDMWLPHDDPYRSPNYEIFLVMHSLLCFGVVQTFAVYVYIFFHILLHKYFIMNMMILDIEVIFDGLDESVAMLSRYDPRRIETQNVLNARVARIVQWHIAVLRTVRYVSLLYGPTLVYQVMFSSITICAITYQIAEKLEQGQIHVLFLMLFVAALLQLWIPCYLGTVLRNKAFDVGNACWLNGWHETPLGMMIRQDIIIFIARSQQPVTIKFVGLPNVQLETFSSILSTSYSYFNMLRQYSK